MTPESGDWDPAVAAVELDRASERVGWPMLRRLLRAVREEFVRQHETARPAAPDAAPPADSGKPLDLLAWGRQYLPEHFQKPPSAMHRWMAERLDAMTLARGSKLNVLGPRGAAKSTVGTLAFPLRAALEKREPYIWIVSDTKEQARTHLDNLKAELVDNPHIARDYPEAAGRGPVWRAGAVVLRNGVTVEAYGTGQRIRGRRRRENRPTLIVCDDIENDAHRESALLREHARNWFHGALMKAGTPWTNVVSLATALHREALAVELHATPGWTSRVFRSIDPWPDNMGLWRQWEALYAAGSEERVGWAKRSAGPPSDGSSTLVDPRSAGPPSDGSSTLVGPRCAWPTLQLVETDPARRFYEERRAAMDAGAGVLWPEMEDLYALMRIRAESGRSAFEREKQCSPLGPEMCEWPEEYFGEHLWFDEWPARLAVRVLALDPSKGADARRGDYSAFVRLGVDRQGVLYVEADLARRPTPQMIADGVEHFHQFRPHAFGVEANQFQELLAPEFEAEFRRQGMLGVRPWLVHNDANKRVRIRRLGPHLAARRMRMKAGSPGTRLLVEQLREFPAGEHDDGPDALEMALRLAEAMLSPTPDDGLGSRLVT